MLHFLIPSSCIVASNKELSNTFSSFKNSLLLNPLAHNNMNTNIEINTLKGQFNISNTNNFRELSVYSSISSICGKNATSS